MYLVFTVIHSKHCRDHYDYDILLLSLIMAIKNKIQSRSLSFSSFFDDCCYNSIKIVIRFFTNLSILYILLISFLKALGHLKIGHQLEVHISLLNLRDTKQFLICPSVETGTDYGHPMKA